MIRLTGAKEVDDVLRGLPLQLSDRVLSASFSDAAKPMVEAARSFAPTGETDNLIDSIGIVKEKSMVDGQALGQIQVGPRRKGKYKGYIAHIIEFGSVVRRTKSGANRGAVKANPFMQKALDQTTDQVLGRINNSIGTKLFQFIKRTIKNA